MWERGCFPPKTLIPPRKLHRTRGLYAASRTLLQCVRTRRRNCIRQLSPFSEYAPGTVHFPVWKSVTIKLTHYPNPPGSEMVTDAFWLLSALWAAPDAKNESLTL